MLLVVLWFSLASVSCHFFENLPQKGAIDRKPKTKKGDREVRETTTTEKPKAIANKSLAQTTVLYLSYLSPLDYNALVLGTTQVILLHLLLTSEIHRPCVGPIQLHAVCALLIWLANSPWFVRVRLDALGRVSCSDGASFVAGTPWVTPRQCHEEFGLAFFQKGI